MSAQAPHVLSRRTNGVLQAGASQTNESPKSSSASRSGRGRGSSDRGNEAKATANDAETPRIAKSKTPSEGEKLVIRRLPPGMTQAEFVSILGQDWEVGKGKVDWLYYGRGKVSNDPSKPSRPARAYLHLMRKDDIMPLSELVSAAAWEDAKNTFTSASLIGPPCLEFAIYKKVPGNKKRTDARQGTIDQDAEFMAFLEGLANPAPLREAIDQEDNEDTAKAEVTSTPLTEYLKEKKANKLKEAAAAKSAKHARQEAASKGKAVAKEDDGSKKKGAKETKSSKSDKAPSKEPVKILTKKVAVEQAAEAAKNAATRIVSSGTGTAPSTTAAAASEAQPKSRRAGIAQAARILQRDLGLSPGSAHRRARQDAAKAEADSKTSVNGKTETQHPTASTESVTSQSSKTQPASTAKTQSQGRRSRGSGKNTDKAKPEATSTEKLPPVILKKAPTDAESVSESKAGSTAKSSPPKKSSAARGFVKHANASQGITEAALKQALETFGSVTLVEMDKRKGFAYVDFADAGALAKAIAASPLPIAQGTVQVLERKDKKPANGTAAPAEKSTSRGRRGRGGGNKAQAAGDAAG